MTTTRAIYGVLLACLVWSCSGNEGRLEHATRAGDGDPPTVADECPTTEFNADIADAIPDDVTTNPFCKYFIWDYKERHLCRAHYFFRRASTLNTVLAGSASDRLKLYYQATLALSEVLYGRSSRVGDYNESILMDEQGILDSLSLPRCGSSSPFPVEPLVYWRGLRKEGLELYRQIAEHFVYAMTAEADWQRGLSGDTSTFSANVWGDDFSSFLGIRGTWRGKALGYLTGLDTVELQDLYGYGKGTIFTYCGGGNEQDEAGFYLSRPECQTRYVVNLPGCSVDGRSERVQRAIELIRQYGVIWDEGAFSHDGSINAQYLAYTINNERIELGLDAIFEVDDLLDLYGTDVASVGQAAKYLDEEREIYLYDLEPGSYFDKDVRKGLGRRHDQQQLMTLARVNSSRLWQDDRVYFDIQGCPETMIDPAECPLGYPDFTFDLDYYLRHSYFKVTANLRDKLRSDILQPWWSPTPVDPDSTTRLAALNQDMVRLVDEEIGSEQAQWDFTFNDMNVWTSPEHPGYMGTVFGYTVQASVPAAMAAGGSLRVISGQPLESWGGVSLWSAKDEKALDGLKCAVFGTVRGAPCSLESFELPLSQTPHCSEGSTCVELDFSFTNGFWSLDGTRPATTYPMFLMLGDKIIDAMIVNYGPAWVDWIALEHTRTVRNILSESAMRRVERIIARDVRQCSEPVYNSLGLRNDLVPPHKTELQVGISTTPFEDSYRYYLDKAKESSLRASGKIAELNNLESKEVKLQTEVEERRATALNRVEQICGAGRSACSTPKGDYTLGELGLLRKGWPWGELYCTGQTDTMPAVRKWQDTTSFAVWLLCQGKELGSLADNLVVVDLPDIVAQSPGDAQPLQASFDGEYLTVLLDVSNGVVDVISSFERIVQAINTAVDIVNVLREKMHAAAYLEKASWWRKLGMVIKGITGAMTATASGGAGGAGGFGAMASMVTDMTATVLEDEARRHSDEAEVLALIQRANASVFEAEQAFFGIKAAVSRVQQGIQRVKGLELEQEQQAGNVDRAELGALRNLLGGNPAADDEQVAIKTYRKYLTVKHMEAYQALRRAQRMGFIARRALELKLGVDLTREKSTGIIVDAPYKWVDALFRIYDANGIFSDSGQQDYVTSLEDYLYGYPFDHPFADADDIAIISVSDDLLNIRGSYPCEGATGGPNYARNSERVETWQRFTPDGLVIQDEAAPSPVDPTQITAEHVAPARDPWWFYLGTEPVVYDGASLAMNGSLYLRATAMPLEVQLFVAVSYHDAVSDLVLRWDGFGTASGQEITVAPADGWVRIQTQGSVSPPGAGEVMKVMLAVSSRGGPADAFGGQITSGEDLQPYQRNPAVDPGCQLHQWVDPISGLVQSTYMPRQEVIKEAMRERFYVKCRQNEEVIPAGRVVECGNSSDVEYFETDFDLTLGELQEGRILRQSQFAVGNFNFRISDLAVNLVGSNVKDCELDPGAGAACWQNLFIPYDLSHGGAVVVTDYEDKGHEFRLATGNIHHGKALAAERLLTNPLSSTDSAALSAYIKPELRGRPIQGSYTLRIYNVPGLRWDNIEDVQIYLKYRYWSAFSNP